MMNFKVGDKAIYPGYGLGRIESIETKEISGVRQKFYSILIINSDMKIMVPESRMQSVRSIITPEEARKVLEVLVDSQHATGRVVIGSGKNWSKRYQYYMKIIKTGDIFDTARILRELLTVEKNKGLSFYEKQLMLTVCKMLFEELSVVIEKKELQKALDFPGLLSTLEQ